MRRVSYNLQIIYDLWFERSCPGPFPKKQKKKLRNYLPPRTCSSSLISLLIWAGVIYSFPSSVWTTSSCFWAINLFTISMQFRSDNLRETKVLKMNLLHPVLNMFKKMYDNGFLKGLDSHHVLYYSTCIFFRITLIQNILKNSRE